MYKRILSVAAVCFCIMALIIRTGINTVSETEKDILCETTLPAETKKTAYLTFDDGPSSITPEILDILKENDIKATFFVIGNQINEKTEDILKRMCTEGHRIGVHTFSHKAEEIYQSSDSFFNDIMKTEELIAKCTGHVSVIFRFPWGSVNSYIRPFRENIIEKLRKKGIQFCDWNVSGEDSVGKPSADEIFTNVKRNFDICDEPVILLHDSEINYETLKALPEIIKLYREAGYGFATINERTEPYQWNPVK